MVCPYCNSEDIRRSISMGWERVPRLLFARKHFRCLDCNSRWAASALDLREDKKTILIWATVFTAVGFGLRRLFHAGW
ncbi:MAG: hypothetical protein PHI34_06585 [Acidobacteriota bacterium]|nr:hypothetical protein [Acidobacteriota bacterium]